MSNIFESLLTVVAPIARNFTESGYRLYLVGGVVRDALLANRFVVSDLDLTTDASPEVIRKLVTKKADAIWLQGEKFGTIGLRIGDHNFEITTHRSESYLDDSRKPVVVFSKSLDEDLARRDFTINAMAVDAVSGDFHDPFGGESDLKTKILKTPLDPQESFSDDPLRMLRAARFIAAYSLTPDGDLVDAAANLIDRLSIVSSERVRDEIFRLLCLDEPYFGFELLVEIGALGKLFPEIMSLDQPSRLKAFNRLSLVQKKSTVRLAALFFDVELNSVSERIKFLRLSRKDSTMILKLLQQTQIINSKPLEFVWSDEAVRRFFLTTTEEYFDAVLDFAKSLGINDHGLEVAFKKLLAVEELSDLRPALDGQQVMSILNLSSGSEVGKALEWLVELRLRKGQLPLDQVEFLLAEWWDTQTD